MGVKLEAMSDVQAGNSIELILAKQLSGLLSVPLFLLIGGEKRGITRSFRDAADLRLNIPYHRDFRAAMSTGTAAAVIGFELMRQRQSA